MYRDFRLGLSPRWRERLLHNKLHVWHSGCVILCPYLSMSHQMFTGHLLSLGTFGFKASVLQVLTENNEGSEMCATIEVTWGAAQTLSRSPLPILGTHSRPPLSLQTLYSYCHTPARSFGGYPWAPEATMPHTKSHSPWVFTYPPGERGQSQ